MLQIDDNLPSGALVVADNVIAEGGEGFSNNYRQKVLSAAKSEMAKMLSSNRVLEATDYAAAILVLEGERGWNKAANKRMKKDLGGRISELLEEENYRDAAPYAKNYILLFDEEPCSPEDKLEMLGASLMDMERHARSLGAPSSPTGARSGEELIREYSPSERVTIYSKAAIVKVLGASEIKSSRREAKNSIRAPFN